MKKFNVTYVCNTMFLKWTITVEAKDEDEAMYIFSKKGKIISITEVVDHNNSKL